MAFLEHGAHDPINQDLIVSYNGITIPTPGGGDKYFLEFTMSDSQLVSWEYPTLPGLNTALAFLDLTLGIVVVP